MVSKGNPFTAEKTKSLRARFMISMFEGVFKFLVLKQKKIF
jgi:hypothetical protein